MSHEARGARTALARLRAEIASDRAALARRLEEAEEVLGMWSEAPPGRPYLALAAVALHGWYTGLETILERIAREVDHEVPAGDASHRLLLSQAMTDVGGVRPAVLPRSLEPELIDLLSFRHFFRHAYAVDLDPDRIHAHLRRLGALSAKIDAALDAFDRFLESAERAIVDPDE